MRRLATVAAIGLAAVIASLSCAGPALADIGGPSGASLAITALVIIGVIVAGVVFVCILVLRSIARSRHEERQSCRNCGRQVAEGAPYCLSCGAPQPTERESADGISVPQPGVDGAAREDAAAPEDDHR